MGSSDNAVRSPLMRAFAFSSTIASAVFGDRFGLVECGLQVFVGHERDTSGQLHLRLRGEILGDGRVLLNAGLADELLLHVAPILLGDGTALFEHIDGPVRLENMEAVQSRHATHLRFRVVK